MKNISIRQKIIFASMAPVILLSLIMMWVVYNASHTIINETTGMISSAEMKLVKEKVM